MNTREAKIRALRELAMTGNAYAEDLDYEGEHEIADAISSLCAALARRARKMDPEFRFTGRQK